MIFVFGKNGQLGSALLKQLGDRAIGFDREAADFTLRPAKLGKRLEKLFKQLRPTLVINAAAYTAVDQAQTKDGGKEAFFVNGYAPGVLAQMCTVFGVPIIHYSSDYVYEGTWSEPAREYYRTRPCNVYGESKAFGDAQVEIFCPQHLVLRTSWLYDAGQRNFVNTMMRLGKEREELKIVADQIGAPTYAGHLADATVKIIQQLPLTPTLSPQAGRGGSDESAGARTSLERRPMGASGDATGDIYKWGIYHACNTGETSWHDFAQAIFAEMRARGDALAVRHMLKIAAKEYGAAAPRPTNSRLDCSKIKQVFRIEMPSWQDGLKACMDVKYANK